MELFVLGTSQSVASTQTRERMHVDMDEVFSTLGTLTGEGKLLAESIPLGTCGRLELYAVAEDVDRAIAVLVRLMARHTGFSREKLAAHSYVHRGREAIRHLFRVAAGLDSVVHGEAQILGQVRHAAHEPAVAGLEGPYLHRLFENALTAGKRVRSETEIGRGAASLASAALTMVRRELEVEQASVLILGAGDTGALIGHLLHKAGAKRIVVANRTLERARKLATDLGGEACGLASVRALLPEMDLIVGAITTEDHIFSPDDLPPSWADGRGPRFFLDLAHPRNFDPALDEVDGVRVFDLEHVFKGVQEAREKRAAEVPLAESLVDQEMDSYVAWLRSRANAPILKAVRTNALDRALAEAERYAGRVPEEHRDQMRKLARSVARAILHHPTVALRDADPQSVEGRALIENALELFGLEPVPEESAL